MRFSNSRKNGQLQIEQSKKTEVPDLLSKGPLKLHAKMIENGLRNKTILITGAAGSVGSEIVRQLSRFTIWKIVLVDNAESSMYRFENELAENYARVSVESIMADVTDEVMMNRIFSDCQPDIVFHAATNKHVPMMEKNPHEAIRVNVGSTAVLTKLSIKHGIRKFILISTNKAVNPTGVMGASMRICEMLLQARSVTPGNRTQFLITRFGNLIDSDGSVIQKFSKQIAAGGPVTVTHPDMKRCFMTTHEACQLVLESCFMGLGGEIFEFDMGEPVKILELARQMIIQAGHVPGRDIRIDFTGYRPGEKPNEQLRTAKEKTLPTYNPRIKVAEVAWLDHRKILTTIRALLDSSPYLSKRELIRIIEGFVTDFRSSIRKYNDRTVYTDSVELEHYPD